MLKDLLYCILDHWQQSGGLIGKDEAKVVFKTMNVSGKGETDLNNIEYVKLVLFLVKEK